MVDFRASSQHEDCPKSLKPVMLVSFVYQKTGTYVKAQKVSIMGMIYTDTHKQKKPCCCGENESRRGSGVGL